MRRLAIVGAAVVMAAMMPAHAATTHAVEVRNNVYLPAKIDIALGDSVQWTVIDAGHTITESAESPRFDHEGLDAGAVITEGPFTVDETISYYCRVHAGMVGVIVVGEGSPLPPPDAPRTIRSVPDEYATIGEALVGIPSHSTVEVAPGTYPESLAIVTPDVIVAGTGADPSDVVIVGSSDQPDTVLLFADDAGLANLTVTNAGFNGVRVTEVDGFSITDVALVDNERAGLLVHGARGGWVTGGWASGHTRAGYAVADCIDCDVTFAGVTASANFVGIDVEDAGGVVVTDSTIADNGTGIALRTTWLEGQALDAEAPQRGSHIYANTIADNDSLTVTAPAIGPNMPLRTGSGVWIGGGSHNVIQANTISGHLYGVVVTGLIGPSMRNAIIDNKVSDSIAADLAWDGIGLGTCFGGNTAATYEPAGSDVLYDCALPTTAGVPYPVTTVTVLDWATV